MKIVCSWCNTEIGTKEPLQDISETHGICDTCFQREKAAINAYHKQEKNRLTCQRCLNSWIKKREQEPICCPRCKSAFWNKERKYKFKF